MLLSALAIAIALLCPPAQAQSTPEVTTRSTEFEYHPVHGQVTLERIDPGLDTCVEKAYAYDDRGNKTRVTVRPCAHIPSGSATWFAPRITVNEFAARTQDDPGATPGTTTHPAGAYLTGTRSGAADAAGTGVDTSQPYTQDEAAYDTRFGAAVRQTNVAVGDTRRNLSTRTTYDGFGRVTRQTSALGTYVETAYKICPRTLPADPVCLTYSVEFEIKSPTKRMVNERGEITQMAKARAISAYYIESTPRAADGTVIGAISRVHYDALHREIAKETQTYDGRWSRTLTAYDQLGMAAATWGPHFADNGSTEPPLELRQWTAERDLLHRPIVQSQYVRTTLTGTAVVVSAKPGYNGLESTLTSPAPGGGERTTRSLKNGAGQTAQSIDAYGATLNMAYDAMGQLRKTVDALGNTSTIEYTRTTARFKTTMTDPDLGRWRYTYDALGQLKSQTDAKEQTTDLVYDVLGRLVAKTNPTLNANWYYDRIPAGSPNAGSWCANGLNRLCEATAGNTIVRRQRTHYDDLGRPDETTTVLDRAYVSSVSYSASTGALETATYPSGFKLRYYYSTAGSGRLPGVLESVADHADPNRVFWSIANQTANQVFDARGQLLQARLGNGVQVLNQFDPISGKALALRARSNTSLPPEQSDVLNQTLEYDQVSNIVTRNTAAIGIGLTEVFNYDLLDRLTVYKVGAAGDASAMRTVTTEYNAVGSILSKSDVGGYAYNASGTPQPHAVRSAGGVNYEYDANGSLISTTGAQTRVNTWTAFNQPERMKYADRTVGFLYDHDYKRVQETLTYRDSNVAVRTTYMIHPDNAGGLGYEREISNGKDESRHYISVGGSVIAVVKTLNISGMLNGAVSSDPAMTNYWHKDSLGSVVAVSNAQGAVLERMAFDAWGRRIKPSGGNDANLDPAHGDRGFTGHEHLDELALVHMNGRIYDPLIGRFLSGDPVIQSPEDLQNYNRYTYVLNNPLRYTDPSGNCIDGISTGICVAMFMAGTAMIVAGNKYWQMVGTLLVAAALGGQSGIVEPGMGATVPATYSTANGLTAAEAIAINGAIAGAYTAALASGGDPSAIAQGAFFGAAFGAAGQTFKGPEAVFAHALLGCAQGAMSGGKCGPSAMAAAFGKAMTQASQGMPLPAQFTVTVIAGGTASVIGGGKFANGAFQAGFGYVLNNLTQMLEGRAADRLIGAYLQSQFPELDIRLQQRAYWPWQAGYGIVDMVVMDGGTEYHFEIKKYTYAASESIEKYWDARNQLRGYVLSQPNASVGDWGKFFGDLGNWAFFEGGVRFSSGRTFGGGIVFGPDSYSSKSGLIFYQFFRYQGSSNGPPLWIDYTKRRR
ncbi:MAG TPA: RHS repeat-associated core domain-containing protein [Burkholderiaceae bacterium]|nr:RHS repeat-associated core domain-containing protein [Burkholderiaceae bacterium]